MFLGLGVLGARIPPAGFLVSVDSVESAESLVAEATAQQMMIKEQQEMIEQQQEMIVEQQKISGGACVAGMRREKKDPSSGELVKNCDDDIVH
ncbi:hypothetical protein BLNAU_12482 [Blattamonas nauphoetae]|uniref:Uncharacterized protein n=1 Tax=Blattamonas nauphoetae TaxID=2049346 RepID=A0ABQ9XM94_9EUKA|nr:hypothetical protein BLNAU_12482 [Blattamonas nauphoetae]